MALAIHGKDPNVRIEPWRCCFFAKTSAAFSDGVSADRPELSASRCGGDRTLTASPTCGSWRWASPLASEIPLLHGGQVPVGQTDVALPWVAVRPDGLEGEGEGPGPIRSHPEGVSAAALHPSSLSKPLMS